MGSPFHDLLAFEQLHSLHRLISKQDSCSQTNKKRGGKIGVLESLELMSRKVFGISWIFRPSQMRLPVLNFHHLDTIRYRTGEITKITTYARIFNHFVFSRKAGLERRNRLMRRIFASDVAKTTFDALGLIDLGN
jgi:hypothetical protein